MPPGPPILTAANLSKAFVAKPLFSSISLSLEDRERLALIGPNGSGKSTLLKILAGIESADSGTVTLRKGLRTAYVPQSDAFPPGSTILSALTAALAAPGVSIAAVHDDHERELHARLALARTGFSGFDDPDTPTATLSGGQKKRLAITRELAKEPDLLLLDEPTNHLDVEGILWLESLLRSASFSWIIVTHDRAFLDSTASRIVELSRAYPDGTFSVTGNYTEFLRRKQDFLEGQAKQEQALANEVREDLRWLGRGAQARRTKSKSRITASYERMDQLDELRARNAPNRAAAIDFTATQRRTQKLLVARAISKRFGDQTLFTDLDLLLGPGDTLGLLGPNGSGKSTLIKILTGELQPDPPSAAALAAAAAEKAPPGTPDPGTIRRADNLRTVVFSQHRTELDPKQLLGDALAPHTEVIFRGRPIHIVTWAARFLFHKDQLQTPIATLSGGEQARVHIARLMLQPADILILDEPTNDLDIASLEVLEESLEEFPGAIVLVTHDRAMLARLSTRLLALGIRTDDGAPGARYFASYEQWEDHQRRAAAAPTRDAALRARDTSAPAPAAAPAKKKLSYNEQRELAAMESTIHDAEALVRTLEAAMADPATAADHKTLDDVCRRLSEAQHRVETLYARWADLDARS